jgi:hypothetical protein
MAIGTISSGRILILTCYLNIFTPPKLCTHATLRAIHEEKGQFITILPKTRQEDSQFRTWLLTHTPEWQEVARYKGRLKDDPPDIIRAVDSPFPDPDGFRLLWFHSSEKEERDAEDRQERIARVVGELELLKAKVESPRSRLKTREGIAQKADRILSHRGAQKWLRYTIEVNRVPKYRQEKRGRTGTDTVAALGGGSTRIELGGHARRD